MSVLNIRVTTNPAVADGITHAAPHHADEVFATVMLARCYKRPLFYVYRTRDRELAQEIGAPYVYDIGGEFDPKRGRFDHHQPNFNERRNGGSHIPLLVKSGGNTDLLFARTTPRVLPLILSSGNE